MGVNYTSYFSFKAHISKVLSDFSRILLLQANKSLWGTWTIIVFLIYFLDDTQGHISIKQKYNPSASHYMGLTQTILLTAQWRIGCFSHPSSPCSPRSSLSLRAPYRHLTPWLWLVKARREDKSLLRPGHGRVIFPVLVVSTWCITVVMHFLDLLVYMRVFMARLMYTKLAAPGHCH